MTVVDYFDDVYGRFDRFWGNGIAWRYSTDPDDYPTSLISQTVFRIAGSRKPGPVLDLGAGEGLDAIRLARLGYRVHAVEASSVGAAKIRRFAAEMGVVVDVEVCDVRDFRFGTEYEFIICNGLLHYIADKEPLIRRMQQATAPGGYNVISTWSTFTPVPECHGNIPAYCDDEEGVIRSRYRHWVTELVYFERDKLETSHQNLPSHRHSFIKLIAKKPGP